MNITKNWLIKKNACEDGLEWFVNHKEKDVTVVVKKLVKENHFGWAIWLLTNKMNKSQCVKYAIYAAKKVLHIFEEKHPEDKRPRKALIAAEKYLKNPLVKNGLCPAVLLTFPVNSYTYPIVLYGLPKHIFLTSVVVTEKNKKAASASAASAYAAFAAEKKLKTQIISYGLKILGAVK